MKIAFRHVPFDAEKRAVIDHLASQNGAETLWLSDEQPELSVIEDCEILMGYFPAEMLKSLKKLKWIQTPAAGVDKLCGDYYADPDVILTNCSGAFGTAISEYIFTGLLMLMRLMPAYMDNQKKHIWKCEGLCRSIFGSTITVVGTGDIGTSFAGRAKAFGAHIRGVRRNFCDKQEYFDEMYTTDRLSEAVQGADAVVLCLPGTIETRGLVSEEILSKMSPGTILVNCGRGYTLDQTALTKALQEKKLAGAVLDVASVEPLPEDDPLWDMENVIITPHISGHDDDPVNYEAIFSIFLTNLKHYFAGEPLEHVVDRKIGY